MVSAIRPNTGKMCAYVCVGVCERERDRETERDRERQINRQTNRKREIKGAEMKNIKDKNFLPRLGKYFWDGKHAMTLLWYKIKHY